MYYIILYVLYVLYIYIICIYIYILYYIILYNIISYRNQSECTYLDCIKMVIEKLLDPVVLVCLGDIFIGKLSALPKLAQKIKGIK